MRVKCTHHIRPIKELDNRAVISALHAEDLAKLLTEVLFELVSLCLRIVFHWNIVDIDAAAPPGNVLVVLVLNLYGLAVPLEDRAKIFNGLDATLLIVK